MFMFRHTLKLSGNSTVERSTGLQGRRRNDRIEKLNKKGLCLLRERRVMDAVILLTKLENCSNVLNILNSGLACHIVGHNVLLELWQGV